MNTKDRLYIAYGSNLNLEQMKRRCPTAEVVGTAELKNWRLWCVSLLTRYNLRCSFRSLLGVFHSIIQNVLLRNSRTIPLSLR